MTRKLDHIIEMYYRLYTNQLVLESDIPDEVTSSPLWGAMVELDVQSLNVPELEFPNTRLSDGTKIEYSPVKTSDDLRDIANLYIKEYLKALDYDIIRGWWPVSIQTLQVFNLLYPNTIIPQSIKDDLDHPDLQFDQDYIDESLISLGGILAESGYRLDVNRTKFAFISSRKNDFTSSRLGIDKYLDFNQELKLLYEDSKRKGKENAKFVDRFVNVDVDFRQKLISNEIIGTHMISGSVENFFKVAIAVFANSFSYVLSRLCQDLEKPVKLESDLTEQLNDELLQIWFLHRKQISLPLENIYNVFRWGDQYTLTKVKVDVDKVCNVCAIADSLRATLSQDRVVSQRELSLVK